MGRAPCCDKASVKRGPWSPEEDETLRNYIQTHGTGGNWIALPKKAGLRRCGKSCRLRWLNYLRPDIKHGDFTEEEDTIICSLYNDIGSRWSVIASRLSGRTDNDVKNYWNTKLKKKLQAGKITLTGDLTSANETLTYSDNNSNAMTINFENNMPQPNNFRQIDHQPIFNQFEFPSPQPNTMPPFAASTGSWPGPSTSVNDFQGSACDLSGYFYHPQFDFAEPETCASSGLIEFSGNNMSTSSSSISHSSPLGVDSNNVSSLQCNNGGIDGCGDNHLMNLGSDGEFSFDTICEFLLGERSS